MAFDFPASPTPGQPFTPVSGGPAYAWDGTAWRMTSGGINSGVFIGDAPPANPVPGQLWWESDSGNTFIYFSDGSSSQWVQFNASPVPGNVITNIVQTVITSSGTYTKPAGLKFLEVWCIGGGGGGNRGGVTGAGTTSAGGGGGGGGSAYKFYNAADLAASEVYSVGAGGASPGGTAAAGGASSFKALSAAGGGPGAALTATAAAQQHANYGLGGGASGGDLNVRGSDGGYGWANPGGRANTALCGDSGGSQFAQKLTGLITTIATPPIQGNFPGGGATGGGVGQNQPTPTAGAVGGAGAIILKEYF